MEQPTTSIRQKKAHYNRAFNYLIHIKAVPVQRAREIITAQAVKDGVKLEKLYNDKGHCRGDLTIKRKANKNHETRQVSEAVPSKRASSTSGAGS